MLTRQQISFCPVTHASRRGCSGHKGAQRGTQCHGHLRSDPAGPGRAQGDWSGHPAPATSQRRDSLDTAQGRVPSGNEGEKWPAHVCLDIGWQAGQNYPSLIINLEARLSQ